MTRQSTNSQVLASAQHGASTFYSSHVNLKSYEYAMISLDITAKSGSPTLDVSLLMSAVDPAIDNTKWRKVYDETSLTSFSTLPMYILGNVQTGWIGWLKISFTVGGTSTPKLTFSANIFAK